MKFAVKTALGIDISDGMINMALLRQSAKGIELLKAVSAPVPKGAITDGDIENPAKLAKAIKDLRTRNKIRTRQAAVSLFARPVVLQIFDMPKGGMTNVGQFVRNELKSYVILSGIDFACDFCRTSSGMGHGSRLLAAATDSHNVAKLAQTTDMAGLNVKIIEPPLLSYTRALYAKKIEGKFDSDVLIAILRDGVLRLCVFRKQILDLVRIEDISEEQARPDELSRWLPEKINEIIQSYDFEVADSSGNWEITVVADCMELPQSFEESLKTEIKSENVQVRSGQSICQDTVVAQKDGHEKASLVAIGLGIGLLNQNDNGLRINLVPPESAEVRAVKKQLFVTTAIIAAMPLFMVLGGTSMSLTANNVKGDIAQKKQADLSEDTYTLLREQELLDKQIKQISDIPARLSTILGSRPSVNWANILEDVRKLTPKTVRIINLYSRDSSRMALEGMAISYETIHLFVKMLNNSDYISSATLTETTKEDKANDFIMYTIDCELKLEKEEG
ncbi:MAG: pilus assembly protein PilM [Planctomycetes bacterium]|nr:pilus assembly protein PilM [Planctomycetota bacterium]MBL7142849.1 pilus assembly protein PilM [Phycisphaerae bacterium]